MEIETDLSNNNYQSFRFITHEEFIEELYGKIGTKERDEFEYRMEIKRKKWLSKLNNKKFQKRLKLKRH